MNCASAICLQQANFGYICIVRITVNYCLNIYLHMYIDTTDPSDPTEPTPEGRHVAMAAPQRLLCVSRADCQSK